MLLFRTNPICSSRKLHRLLAQLRIHCSQCNTLILSLCQRSRCDVVCFHLTFKVDSKLIHDNTSSSKAKGCVSPCSAEDVGFGTCAGKVTCGRSIVAEQNRNICDVSSLGVKVWPCRLHPSWLIPYNDLVVIFDKVLPRFFNSFIYQRRIVSGNLQDRLSSSQPSCC